MTSIRAHLTRRLTVGTFLVAAGGLLLVFVYLRFELFEQFDNALASRARTLGSLVQIDERTGRLELELTDRAMAEYRSSSHQPDYFQVWDEAGGVIARSTSLDGKNLALAPQETPLTGGKRYYNVTLPDGRAGRAVEVLVEPTYEADEAAGPATAPATRVAAVRLVLATDLAELNEAFRHTLAVGAAVIVILSIGTLWTVKSLVNRGLRPLSDIGDAVARIDPATLANRFETGTLPEELQPVAGKLNELLARLDAAFRRERRFTSNVAHELRTPLAELRSLAEVSLKFPDGDGDPASTAARNYADVLGIARQMESVVAALLAIARSDAGQQRLTMTDVNLSDIVTEAWRPHAERAAAHGLIVSFDIPTSATIHSDRTVFVAMLGNLFANAVTYTPRGGRVGCGVRPASASNGATTARYVLDVSNTNDSLTAADLPFLAEPFWRKDAARTEPANSGLGMALVTTYAKLLGIKLVTSLPTPDEFRVSLEIPAGSSGTTSASPARGHHAAQPIPADAVVQRG